MPQIEPLSRNPAMLNPQEVHLRIGSHLGKYRLLEELGEGPISHVYLADDTILYRQVALKVLKPSFARELAGDSAEEEMNPAAVLLHSGIVPLYGTGAGGGFHYFSMALMPGGNLRAAMERGISPQQALTVISQVARALAFAHAKGINHQAIKPENILFRKDGSAVLSDFHVVKVHGFGLGALAQEPEPHPHYISPEQIQQSGKQFGRADLYTLGIVLYEMLTGEVPFQGENAPWQHIHSPVPKLPLALSEYQGLIDQLLAKKPSERFVDVNQLIKAIDQFAGRKSSERGGNVAVFPGGKLRLPEGSNGDRPFIEGRTSEGVDREPHPAFTPPDEAGGIPLDNDPLPRGSAFPAPRFSPSPFAAPLPGTEEIPDHGSIGDLIPEPPKRQAPPRPESRPRVAQNRRRRETRRRAAFVAALVAVLAASGFVWWKGERIGEALSFRSTPTLPAEEKTVPPAASPRNSDLSARFSEAVAYSRSGRSQEAAALFKGLTEQFPQLPEPFNNLAVLYAAEGDLGASQQMLEEALRVNPSYATILENLNAVQLEKALGGEYRGQKSAPSLQMLTDLSASAAPSPPRPAAAAAPPPAARPALPPASPPQGEKSASSSQAAATVQEWAKAWSAQDYPRYLAFYGKAFRPPEKQSRSAWEKGRHDNITSPAWIEISLSEMHVTPAGSDRLRVVAVQEYRSDRYRDKTLKALELGKEGDGWVILSEENLGKFR